MNPEQILDDRASETVPEPLPPRPKGRTTGPLKLEIGARLEAQDLYKNWYPARVVEVDDEDREVLIHFEGWNQRHDECIEFDSPRLRPVLSEERQDTRAFHIQPNVRVEARWKTIGYFPGTVVAVNDDDSCQVLFDDGVEMKVMKHHIRMPKMKTLQAPNPVSSTEKNKRQERQAWLAEARRQRAMRRNSDGQPKSETPSPLSPEAKRRKCEDKIEPGHMSTEEQFPIAEMALPSLRDEPDRSALPEPKPLTSPIPQSSPPLQTGEPALPHSQMPVPVSAVPSMVPMMNVNDKQNPQEMQLPPQQPVVTTMSQADLTTPPNLASKPLIKRSTRTEPFITRSKTKAAESKTDKSPSQSQSIAPKEWVVLVDHNKFKCTVAGCDKAFRKASLLNYHMKYYHSDDQLDSPRKKQKVAPRSRDISFSETDSPLPQKDTPVVTSQAKLESTETAPALRDSSNSTSPVKEKGNEKPKPLFVLGGRHPHEQLQPIHFQERKKFQKSHGWYWCGDMHALEQTGQSGDAIRQLGSIMTACHNDLAADLMAVDEVLRSLDAKLNLVKNPRNPHFKEWTEHENKDDNKRGERIETEEQELREDKKCDLDTTGLKPQEEGSYSDNPGSYALPREARDDSCSVDLDVGDETRVIGHPQIDFSSTESTPTRERKNILPGCDVTATPDDVSMVSRDAMTSSGVAMASSAVAMTSENALEDTNSTLTDPSVSCEENEDHIDPFTSEVVGLSDILKSPASSGSSTLPDTSENMEITDTVLNSRGEECDMDEEETLDGMVRGQTRLLEEIEKMQDELEERMGFLESQLMVLDGGDVKMLENLRRLVESVERTLVETEAMDMVRCE